MAIPNEDTIEAIEELESGGGKKFDSIEEFFADLEDVPEAYNLYGIRALVTKLRAELETKDKEIERLKVRSVEMKRLRAVNRKLRAENEHLCDLIDTVRQEQHDYLDGSMEKQLQAENENVKETSFCIGFAYGSRYGYENILDGKMTNDDIRSGWLLAQGLYQELAESEVKNE